MAAENERVTRGTIHVLGAREVLEMGQACPVRESNRRAVLLARLRAALDDRTAGIAQPAEGERLSRDFAWGFGVGAVTVGLMWVVIAWLS